MRWKKKKNVSSLHWYRGTFFKLFLSFFFFFSLEVVVVVETAIIVGRDGRVGFGGSQQGTITVHLGL